MSDNTKFKLMSGALSKWNRDQDNYFLRSFARDSPRTGKEGKMWIVEDATIKWFRVARSSKECPQIDGSMILEVAEMYVYVIVFNVIVDMYLSG